MDFLKNLLPFIKKDTNTETGSGVLVNTNLIDNNTETEATVSTYKEMLDSNAIVQGLYYLISLSITSTGWSIIGGDEKQTQEVSDSLTKPHYLGGMTTPLELVIEQMTSGVLFGFSPFEKVWQLVDGKYSYKKIAYRDPSTITIKTDDRGGFDGFTQNAVIGEAEQEVDIPVYRGLLYTFDKKTSLLYGRSVFRSSIDLHKDKLAYLAFEKQIRGDQAYPTIMVEAMEGADTSNMSEVLKTLSDRKTKATMGLPYGLKASKLTTEKTDNNIVELLKYYDLQILQSALGAFMALSVSTSSGSYSLANTQENIFIKSIEDTRKSIEATINSWLLPDLYLVNYPNPVVGAFKFNPIPTNIVEAINASLATMLNQDKLSDEFLQQLALKASDILNLELDGAEVLK